MEDEVLPMSNEELYDYYTKWYQPEYAILCTENFECVLPQKWHSLEKNYDECIYKKSIQFRGIEGFYLYGSNSSWKTYYKLLFIKELVTEYTTYVYRYRHISDFDYPVLDWFMTLQHRVIGIPNNVPTTMPKDFFDTFKNYFISNLFVQYDTSEFCYYNLLEEGMVTKESVVDYVSSFTVGLFTKKE